MQRCPCCNARLTAEPVCPRCGADLSLALRCEHLAKVWLRVSLQTLNAGQPDIAVAAIGRSLSYKQTQAARVFSDFLVQHQYRTLYEYLGKQLWEEAKQTVARLRVLQGDIESLSRFLALIEHLSGKQPNHPGMPLSWAGEEKRLHDR